MKIIDSFYHIYNRGAHKADIFLDRLDYERMLKLLYIANNDLAFELSHLPENIFALEKEKPIVDILAYCLMPNHIHLALRPRHEYGEKGITKFIRKLATGYSNYFNVKYDHSGTIWQGTYKKKFVGDEGYAKTLINYIHLNPFGIEEPLLTKEARREQLERAVKSSTEYEYSSLRDYLGIRRVQSSIIEA